MQPFAYARPDTLTEAVDLLVRHGGDARVLAGGTDLVIRLRDGSFAPSVVVDVKRVPELAPGILATGDGGLVIGATTTMTEIAAHPVIRRDLAALAEAAAVVGSVQIRNRATLAGNLCNASPAADTAPALLVHRAVVVVAGPDGTRRIALDDFFVRSGVTTLAPGELVAAVELPAGPSRMASAHERRTRRRGHDLASVTVACGVDADGVVRLAFGSLGPRPVLRIDESGGLGDPATPDDVRDRLLEAMLGDARPSATSMRAGPTYRLAMLRIHARRALARALERRASGEGIP
ncbi:MAG TPA: xanthine dehydrogenase family protein subunit M [Candidatus Limnocylindrales bacterium]|nr:xanthine dehydrogenase family protein subunit M [Candidatus Limnocylindrales bacterium]